MNTSEKLPKFSLMAALILASSLAVGAFGCGDDEKEDAPEPDASVEVVDGSSETSEIDAGDAPDAGEETDAGEDSDKAFTGCDLMEFAPEHRSNQGMESAMINTWEPSLGYFQEITWFEGGDENTGIWMLDALRFTTQGDPIPLTVGTHQLSGNNLGNSDECTLCIDLGRSNMDDGIDADFYPENVRIVVEQADIHAGGTLKFTVSGIFRENADSSKRSWCINDFAVEAPVQQYCTKAEECPDEFPVCGYPATGSYPVCLSQSAVSEDDDS